MNKQISLIVEKLKEKYKDIDTILVFGSALTKEWNPKASDIDVFLIDDSFNDGRIDEEIDGVKVEILTDNFNNIIRDIESERGKLLNRNVANMISTSEIIIAKSEEKLNKIKKLAGEVILSETIFDDEDVKMWKYSIEDYLSKAEKDAEKNNHLAFYLDAHFVIQNLLELVLAINNKFFLQPKHMKQTLKEIDPELTNELEKYMQLTNDRERLVLLKKITLPFLG